MKNFLLLFTLLGSSFVVYAQATINDVAGTYKRDLSNTPPHPPHIIIYTLTLNADGTFQFHSYDKYDRGITPERNKYAKGTWSLDKKVVYFSTSPSDFDETFTLDFNHSKARFISKHPRDKSDKVVESALRFYESQIDWIQSLYILRIE